MNALSLEMPTGSLTEVQPDRDAPDASASVDRVTNVEMVDTELICHQEM